MRTNTATPHVFLSNGRYIIADSMEEPIPMAHVCYDIGRDWVLTLV
jgi:hypothetical protein